MNSFNKNELIDSLKPEVLKLSITEVIDSRLNGSRLSPFRDDQNEGSFKISESIGVCTDFVEGVTRNAIKFIMDYDGVDFQEAILRIAYEFSLIEEAEYKKYSTNPTTKERKIVTIKEKPKKKQKQKHKEDFLNIVYKMMKNVSGLTDEHKQYLLNRNADPEKYFSYNPKYLVDYINSLERLGHFSIDLLGVPGFYQEGVELRAKDLDGIAIPMINSNGNITAIQIRKDKVEEGEARYVFLSSTGLYNGCSCGSQVDFENLWVDGDLIITEGQFKAVELSKYFNCTCCSVQGVNNIKPLAEEIPNLLKRQDIKRFVIAFDADMVHNDAVKKAAKKLQKFLQEFNIPVEFLVWNEEFGKGADDVIISGNADKFNFVKEL